MTNYVLPATTLNDVIRQSRLIDSTVINSTTTAESAIFTADDNTKSYLKQLLFETTDEMQEKLERRLSPYDEAKQFDRHHIEDALSFNRDLDTYVLKLDERDGDDLLSISSFIWKTTTLTSTDYRFAYLNRSPNYEIVFNNTTTLATLTNFEDLVTITGTWGYHDNFANMWKDSGDTVQNTTQISATETALEVVKASTFETYQIIRIGSEYLFITSLNSPTNILTVERAKNGSVGAIHTNGTQIDTFVPMPSVAKECRRLVLRSWFLKDDPRGNVILSGNLLKELGEGTVRHVIPRRERMAGF